VPAVRDGPNVGRHGPRAIPELLVKDDTLKFTMDSEIHVGFIMT
jgi:hypothetical protein